MPTPISADGVRPVDLIAANLRAERRTAELSLSAVARLAGISKSTLSQLESGQGNPSIETLWAIAIALNIPFSRLVVAPQAEVRVVRAAERTTIHADGSDYGVALLSPGSHARRDLYVTLLEPGKARVAEAHLRGSVEHVVVSQGVVRVGPIGYEIEAHPGDYVTFPGDVAHSYEALEAGSWFTLVMEHPGS